MSRQITNTQSSKVHPFAHIQDTCVWISLFAPFFSLPPTASCNSISTLSWWISQKFVRGRVVVFRNNIGTKRNQIASLLNHLQSTSCSIAPILHVLSCIYHRVVPTRAPTDHSSNLTSVYPVPALQLQLLSTPSNHTVLILVLRVSKRSQ